jgi:hypothetical protein
MLVPIIVTLIAIALVCKVVMMIVIATRPQATPPPPPHKLPHPWDDDDVFYNELEEAFKPESPPAPKPLFSPGCFYRWEPIEDLLWAYGFSHDEVRKMRQKNYIEIYKDGLSASFDGSGDAYDKKHNQLYFCNTFDPQADTWESDRWRQQPTDQQRHKALWGDK